MKKHLLTCLLCCITLFVVAQPSFIKDSLDAYINEGIKDWSIPGLAIVIIKDGKVVTMKGYGVKNLETKEPVDSNTLFMIASNTKLFTGTALAQLEYNKKLSLDDKITKYFPNFRVYDSITTQLVTIKDMLGHHLGTKTFQGDFTFWNSDLSRDSVMYKMRLLKPSQQFRASYGYCNSCFLTAGQVIEKVTNMPWEVYVYDSLVTPIGMTHTQTLGYHMEQMNDVAYPYSNSFSKELTLMPFDNVDNLAPAGSMVSCVSDLSKWLMLQLDSGKLNGKQILPWQVIQKTRDANTAISNRKSAVRPTHFTNYGLGVLTTDFNGKQVYWHTGGADGFVTNVCTVPEEKLGIAILTNNDNQSFFELLRWQIVAAYTGMPFKNMSKQFLADDMADHEKTLRDIDSLKALATGKSSADIDKFVGLYSNPVYGNISIEKKDKDLVIHFSHHAKLTATLQYINDSDWVMTYSNLAYGIFPVHFNNDNGKISFNLKVNDFLEYDPYPFTKL